MVRITIDGRSGDLPDNTSILEAAQTIGIKIPTLCFMKGTNEIGACRVCMVEIEGYERFAPACITPIEEGMVVHTNTPAVLAARRHNVELLLSRHHTACTSCVRNQNCALQKVAADLGVLSEPYPANPRVFKEEKDFPLIRDDSKCIQCMRCIAECERVQACNVWDLVGTGPHTNVGVREGIPLREVNCTLCGQCITHCPVGALYARDDTARVRAAIANPEKILVVNVAPAVRTAWGEGLGLTREEATVGRMVAALKAIGFDYVFDTDFAADLTIIEEGSELLAHLAKKESYHWPLFTSCCPAWIRFVKQSYPEFLSNLSTAKSPHEMFGAVIKTYFAEQAIDQAPGNLFTVSIMPCVAKKYEAGVEELDSAGTGHDIDVSLTVREFERMIRAAGIDVCALPECDFDSPLTMASGAGVIFGRTGGVMEAALRSVGALIGAENLPYDECDTHAAYRPLAWTEKQVSLGGCELKLAVVSGLGNARLLLEALKSGEASYDFVEVMACPGGCVGGGGQPIAFNEELSDVRAQTIAQLDENAQIRLSHENTDVSALYDQFLGKPLGHLSHRLLHTDQAAWKL